MIIMMVLCCVRGFKHVASMFVCVCVCVFSFYGLLFVVRNQVMMLVSRI